MSSGREPTCHDGHTGWASLQAGVTVTEITQTKCHAPGDGHLSWVFLIHGFTGFTSCSVGTVLIAIVELGKGTTRLSMPRCAAVTVIWQICPNLHYYGCCCQQHGGFSHQQHAAGTVPVSDMM